ncbi:hypothetical protein NLI96_g2983 [Meripilus lineatus]|uniref:RTA1-domain-containing protein n=1 Tax=Meripilus lineatus TaxID=2056292 RepID=A0AAD5V7M5_9APHY|nr:hypothetical protein NLI96_g2983 [Physisporinus lineatus]
MTTLTTILRIRDSSSDTGLYGYIPTEWICILFIALFGFSTIVHLIQALYYQLWFLLFTVVIAGIGEVIGWCGRLWSSQSPRLLDPYLMQRRITTTIIAPTPLVAANFVMLGFLIGKLGSKYSRLSPKWCKYSTNSSARSVFINIFLPLDTIVFVSCDIIALVVQAVGGAKASLAVENNEDPGPGGNIMLAGIAFQLAAITIYMTLAIEFVVRFITKKPLREEGGSSMEKIDQKTQFMLFGLMFSSIVIFIRSVYRLIELSDGWTGRIIGTQVYFSKLYSGFQQTLAYHPTVADVLDGGMITLAFYCLNICHPGVLIGPGNVWKRPQSIAETIQVEEVHSEKTIDKSEAV